MPTSPGRSITTIPIAPPAATASTTAGASSSSGAGCRRRPAATAPTAEPAARRHRLAGGAQRKARAAVAATIVLLPTLLLLAASSLPAAHACAHHASAEPATATPTTTTWPDAVSPATRRRLLARATATADTTHNPAAAWSHPLGLDRHGRRRSLLTSTLRRCGTHAPDPATHLKLERAHAIRAAREAAFSPSGDGGTGAGTSGQQQHTIEVPTYVTVVLRDNLDGPTLVSDATVQAQLDTLNKAYGTTPNSPYKWVFVLKAPIARVKVGSPGAAGMCDQKNEAKIKKERRQGGPGALNLYIADLSDCGLLGFSSWPWDLSSKGEVDDGVTVHHMTLPGGTYKPYNMGYTAVHEIGHWLGLYHPFQNGCTGAGDSVDDTNFTATPIEGCPKTRDTCSQPGSDPVSNPMDYTDDACMETFTVGQHQRMESLYRMYRGGAGTNSDGGKERGRSTTATKAKG